MTMAVLCGLAATAHGEEPVVPAPATRSDAQKALEDYANDAAVHNKGSEAAADYHHSRGLKALDEGRTADAVADLTMALDYAPANAAYRKSLDRAKAVAGLSRDTRSVAIDQVADEIQVKQQQLWVEAQQLIEQGTVQLNAGSYTEANRSLMLAQTRLETLPYADERREPQLRSIQALLNETHQRRIARERVEAADRNGQAVAKQRELRQLSQQIERDRVNAMLRRATRARERRDYDEAILLSEQVLKINRAENRASLLLAQCRRERHVYLRQMTADRWDEEHKLLSEDIRKSMLPQLEILTYSTDWSEIDARRGAPVRGLSADETEVWREKIRDQLEQELTLNFQETDLSEVIAFLQRLTNVNIVLDQAVLTGGKPPSPVTLNVQRMKLRFVLDFIMKTSELGYAMRNEAIFISTPDNLQGDAYMKLYDIRDLTHALVSYPGPELDIPAPGSTGTKLLPPIEPERKPETNEFIDIIKKVVATDQWLPERGRSIEEYNGSMIITQTSDVHKQVDELLRQLRNQSGTQIHVRVKFLTIQNKALEEIGVNWRGFNEPAIGAGVPFPLPNQASTPGVPPNPGTPSDIGFYYGDANNQFFTASRLTNQLQGYNTANSLPSPQANEGLTWKSQGWRIAGNYYASAIINAVEKNQRGNILYEPDITMFNGQQAHLVNMNQQSYIADYDIVQGQYDPIVTILSYGTVLDVQAIASADKKYITLTMRPTNAQVAQWRRFGPPIASNNLEAFGGVPINSPPNNAAIAGTNPLLIPELIYQSVRTSVTIPDGGSLVIAGMTNGESARSHSGIPFLSHIPFLGRLFSSNGRQETELRTLIIVQADVILFDEIEKNL